MAPEASTGQDGVLLIILPRVSTALNLGGRERFRGEIQFAKLEPKCPGGQRLASLGHVKQQDTLMSYKMLRTWQTERQ